MFRLLELHSGGFPPPSNMSCPVICTSCSLVTLLFQYPPLPSTLQPEVPAPPSDQPTEDESPGQRTVEVAIPHVGTFVIESEEGGYDDEVASALSDLLSCLTVLRSSGLFNLPLHM